MNYLTKLGKFLVNIVKTIIMPSDNNSTMKKEKLTKEGYYRSLSTGNGEHFNRELVHQLDTTENRSISELENFPFSNILDMKQALQSNKVNIRLDAILAFVWGGETRKYSDVRKEIRTVMLLRWLSIPALIGASYILSNWWLLSFIPALLFLQLFFAYFTCEKAISVTFVLIGVSLLISSKWMLVCSLSLFWIGICVKTAYTSSVQLMIETFMKDENVLCIMWEIGSVKIDFKNESKLAS